MSLIVQRYLVLFEAGPRNLRGFVPDVPGCASIGHSMVELRENLHNALECHLERLAMQGKPLPVPSMGFEDLAHGALAEWMTVRLRLGEKLDPRAMVRPCPGR